MWQHWIPERSSLAGEWPNALSGRHMAQGTGSGIQGLQGTVVIQPCLATNESIYLGRFSLVPRAQLSPETMPPLLLEQISSYPGSFCEEAAVQMSPETGFSRP